MKPPPSIPPRAFTLVEMLVTLAIISLLAVLTFPAINSLLTSSNLNSAGATMGDAILFARNEATAKNRNVEVRFYQLTLAGASTASWSAYQILREDPSNGSTILTAVTRVTLLAPNVVVAPSSSLSPLLAADSSLKGTTKLPFYGTVNYAGFYYRPNGVAGSPLNAANNFLTLQNAGARGTPPADYYGLQVNPVTGKVSTYRP